MKPTFPVTLLTSSLLLLFQTCPALAASVQWPANGHWYEAVAVGPSGITWADAKTAAEAQGGYLASIASDAENLFVFNYSYSSANLAIRARSTSVRLGGVPGHAKSADKKLMRGVHVIAAPAYDAQPLGPVLNKVIPITKSQPWLKNRIGGNRARQESCRQYQEAEMRSQNDLSKSNEINRYANP